MLVSFSSFLFIYFFLIQIFLLKICFINNWTNWLFIKLWLNFFNLIPIKSCKQGLRVLRDNIVPFHATKPLNKYFVYTLKVIFQYCQNEFTAIKIMGYHWENKHFNNIISKLKKTNLICNIRSIDRNFS